LKKQKDKGMPYRNAIQPPMRLAGDEGKTHHDRGEKKVAGGKRETKVERREIFSSTPKQT